jgi:hypothetical protein
MALLRNATRRWVLTVSPAVGTSATGVQGGRVPTGLIPQLAVVYMHVDRLLGKGSPNGPCDVGIGATGGEG